MSATTASLQNGSQLGELRVTPRRHIHDVVARNIRSIAGTEELRILEAGCGRRWPMNLEGVSYQLVGVDLDAEALASRKRDVGDLDQAIVADLCRIDFRVASFDVIYSAFVLEHVCGAEPLLKKFIRWLKPGGLLVLQFPDRASVYGFCTRITPFWLHVYYKRYFSPMGNAGRPGFGPYPTYHDNVISRTAFRNFAADNRLQMKEEWGFGVLPPMQQKFSELLSILSFRKLASNHINLCYVLQSRPPESPAAAAVSTR
jgi:SAM-dependent methyltransferase